MKVVFQDGLHACQRRITCPLAQAINAGMNALTTSHNCRQNIADGQVVIIMCMEIETALRIALHHLSHETGKLYWIEDAECVGQHDALYRHLAKLVHQGKDIVGTVLHAVAPVFEIDIYADALLLSIVNRATDIAGMLFECLVQLAFTMLPAPLAKEVHALAVALHNPVHTLRLIHETEHLHPIELAILTCPTRDALHGLHLAFRDTRAGHLNPIDIKVLQQSTSNHEFLVRHEAYAAGLFTIAQRGVHYLYRPFFSHSSILSVLERRKSMSS